MIDSSLQIFHSYYRFIRSYCGTGRVRLPTGTSIDCDFECGQTEEGDIIIICSQQPERFLESFIQNIPISGFSGRTSIGQLINASNLMFGSAISSSSADESFQSFYARDLTIDTASCRPVQVLRYYIVNFEFIFPITWNFEEYIINVKQIEGYRDAEREMEATKRAKITAFIEVKAKNRYISDISSVERLVRRICDLLSLAKGCLINWLYWDALSSNDTPMKSYHANAVISRYNNYQLILKQPPEDIGEYIQQVYGRYREIQNEGIWNLNHVCSHYASTLASQSFIELRGLNLVSLIEYIIGRFAEHEEINKILKDVSFSDDKQKALRRSLGSSLTELFSEEDLIENIYVAAENKRRREKTAAVVLNGMAFNAIRGLNRLGFPTLMNLLLNNLGLATREKEVKLFVEIRNKLVHEARYLNKEEFEKLRVPYESHTLQFFRVISFTSRIILGILEYQGYYHDWYLFKGAEWAGAESARVKMQYQ